MIRILRLLGITTHRQFRLLLRGIALATALGAAFLVEVKTELHEFCGALKVYGLVAAAAFVEFVFADVLADRSFPFDTERRLALMERRLGIAAIGVITDNLRQAILGFHACDTSRIGAVVHILTEVDAGVQNPTKVGLLQLTDYVGLTGGRKGRLTLINQGIIGRCARTGRSETVDFATAEEYSESMVRDFGFTPEEARRHNTTGRSYLAYPLIKGTTSVGVVYFFTSEPQVFPGAADEGSLQTLARGIVDSLVIAGLV